MGLKTALAKKNDVVRGIKRFTIEHNNNAPFLERKRAKLSDEYVEQVFRESKSVKEGAQKLGISVSYAYHRLLYLGLSYNNSRGRPRVVIPDDIRKHMLDDFHGTVRVYDLMKKYKHKMSVIGEILHAEIRRRIDKSNLMLSYPKNLWQVKIANEILDEPTLMEPDNWEDLQLLTKSMLSTIAGYIGSAINEKPQEAANAPPRAGTSFP